MSNAILSNVYNHYLTTYAPKSTTRYETHKKSELRSIYNSIIKLNKESPWYLETKDKNTQAYAVNIKENAGLLRNSIASLGGLHADHALAKKAAYSTDENIATATFVGELSNEAPIPTLTICVNHLASPQQNTGNYLQNTAVALSPDTYSFDICVNDLNYEFQFNINESDTNKDVQERLMRLINNAGIGIQAALDTKEDRSALQLVSDTTGLPFGREYIFHISDSQTSKRAGAVSYFGLDNVSRQPANSSFLLNGEDRNTSANIFTIGKMYEIELKGISKPDTFISVGLKNDVESLADNVNTLIGSYNTFIKAAGAFHTQEQPQSNRLIREVGAIASRYQTEMASMGIHVQSDHSISIDDSMLKETISSADDSFSPEVLNNFANSLLEKTAQVSLDPMHYVNRTIVAYKNPGHNFASPYITSAYSGMMFNSYC